MSRDYGEYCPECNLNNARSITITDTTKLLQCLNEECGVCFEIKTKYIKLKTKGITEKDWEQAKKEIEK